MPWKEYSAMDERLQFVARRLAGDGVPFASPNSLFQASKLAVWWLRLGITIERIRPGHPQQNGRHERMHLKIAPADKLYLQPAARVRIW